jgi:hypothetical protein
MTCPQVPRPNQCRTVGSDYGLCASSPVRPRARNGLRAHTKASAPLRAGVMAGAACLAIAGQLTTVFAAPLPATVMLRRTDLPPGYTGAKKDNTCRGQLGHPPSAQAHALLRHGLVTWCSNYFVRSHPGGSVVVFLHEYTGAAGASWEFRVNSAGLCSPHARLETYRSRQCWSRF